MVAAAIQLHHARVAVVHALKIAVDANGPVYRAGADTQYVFQFLHQLKRVAPGAVQLVDEGEDGNRAHAAHLKQLDGLLLHALGVVDEHHGAVRGHEGAVGVLGKVLMARSIQYVDAEAVEIELHRGRGNRDAALFFNLHPVRSSVARGLARLDRTGLPDGSAVEQQFFRQRGLARVRVGDDGERAPARHFRRKLRVQHVPSSKSKNHNLYCNCAGLRMSISRGGDLR